MSLLDPSLQLPLAESIVPRLSLQALANLACTCRSLRNVLRSDWLDDQWWRQAAKQKLGSQHPDFQGLKPNREQLRSAVIQYLNAVICMQDSKFKQGEHWCFGTC